VSIVLAPAAPQPEVVSRARYERERRAREEAERLLEDKSRSLFEANQLLRRQADMLEAEVRRRTADLEAARAAADAASQAKSTFLAVMSHEIRTPMNGVLGMAAALAQTELGPDQAAMLDVISASGQLLLGIIDDILDLSKIEAGKLTLAEAPFDLAATIRQAALLFRQTAAEKGIALRVDIAPGLSRRVTGDAMRLGQVLNNLMSNAVKFTERGEVALIAAVEGEVALITVSDTGIGIPEDARARLFQPFFQVEGTARRRHKGTGLGLSISRELAEMMGGSLDIVDHGGPGTAFRLRLPLRDATVAAGAEPAPLLSPTERLHRLRPRVLAVDDNATNRLVLKHLLARQPVDLVIAEGAREGLAICDARDVDVVLMDIQMPDMDGVEAVAELRRREAAAGRRAVPVLAVSANAMPDQIAEYLACGFAGHVAKPVRIDTLVGGILAALESQAAG
jgi:signal transduction histidine kinase/CheY-like chemotaxis protein